MESHAGTADWLSPQGRQQYSNRGRSQGGHVAWLERPNPANHDLPASTEQESLQTLGITEHLPTSIYAFQQPPDQP